MNDEIIIRIPARLLRDLVDDDNTGHDRSESDDESIGERPWSDRQRRYIYRMLQRLGHDRHETAKAYITRTLGLNGSPPTTRQASQLIDRLQAELGGRSHDAT